MAEGPAQGPAEGPAEGAAEGPAWGPAAQAMYRAAQAVTHPGGPTLFADLLQQLAALLPAAAVFVAVFADESRSTLRTLAAQLDGQPMQNFDYPLEGSPCSKVAGGRTFRWVARGVSAEFRPGTIFGARGMDAYAAFPLNDSDGVPLGLLVAMDRAPIADATLAEALLKIFAGRVVAEIERSRVDEALRAAALAVSSAHGETVFAELTRYLATILQVDLAFIAHHEPGVVPDMRVMSMYCDGRWLPGSRYALATSPCARVMGQRFRAFPTRLRELFPGDNDAEALGLESYAGYSLTDRHGQTLGTLGVCSRQPLSHLERIESMLQIFAVRAAAELEQLRAHEALARSEASYRAIFESSEDAIFIHDWDTGEVLDVNPKACATYGYTRDEMLHIAVDRISSGEPPYTAEQAWAHIQLAKLDRCPPFEWHRRNKDGSLHWDEVRLKPVQIDGRPHVLAFTRDITARKQALLELQAREEQYRAVFNGSSDAMALWNRALRIVDVNDAFTRIFGFERDDVVGKSFSRRISPDAAARRVEMIRGALEGCEGAMETDALRKDGSRFEIELRYLPIVYAGEPHVLAVGRDISERRERERALQRSEARLRATVEAAFDCVIGMDGQGRVVEFNAAAERCFGLRRADVLGRELADTILPLRHREAHTRGLKHFHGSGRGPMVGRLVETTARRADGSEFPVELAISVAAVPEGNIFVGHLRDISARRAAEAERAALEAQLRQAQKMEAIGQLTGGIAHDFNNILTSVIGYLVLGQERAETLADATLLRQLGQAQLAAQRARELIAQMLAFARRQRGERRVLALAPLLRQSLQLLRSTLPASVLLEGADAAPAAEHLAVLADAVQIEQVLFNLCINARDAITAHGGNGRIRVELHAAAPADEHCAACGARIGRGPWVELRVADTGPGIPPEVAARMFEPFFTTKDVGRGSGMGLAMVHGIVHDHQGHVVVNSSPGRGTVFRILLPAAGGVADGTPAPHAAPAMPGGALQGRVLLVEDEPMVAGFMAELLGSWGLQVVALADPLAARAWLADPAQQPDLLITDQTMPQLTGLALAREAAALRPGLPVLLYTGHADAVDEAELPRHGVRALLHKPVDAQALRDWVRRCLDD